MLGTVSSSNVRPYGDNLDDGIVQLAFTLPVPYSLSAKHAAVELARKMGLDQAEVAHCQRLCEGFTYFVLYGRCRETVNLEQLRLRSFDIQFLSEPEIDRLIDRHFGRKLVVVGASTGTDTHSVGIDAMLNVKGFDGKHGLEAYRGFEVHNLGSQVPNARLVAEAIAVNADAILVSQTVTQQNLHLHNLTELIELVEAEGLRERILLICGGPRLSHELAKELGYDAGFSRGTYPNHLGTFIVQELKARQALVVPPDDTAIGAAV